MRDTSTHEERVQDVRVKTIECGGIDDQSSAGAQTGQGARGIYRTARAVVVANHQRQSVLFRSGDNRTHGAVRRITIIRARRWHRATGLPPLYSPKILHIGFDELREGGA